MTFDAVLAEIQKYNTKRVLLTGGEPLLQRGTLPFIRKLNELGFEVSIETHGEASIEAASKVARIIIDCKSPSSLMNRGGFEKNIPFIKSNGEIKFVIASPSDYEFY